MTQPGETCNAVVTGLHELLNHLEQPRMPPRLDA